MQIYVAVHDEPSLVSASTSTGLRFYLFRRLMMHFHTVHHSGSEADLAKKAKKKAKKAAQKVLDEKKGSLSNRLFHKLSDI